MAISATGTLPPSELGALNRAELRRSAAVLVGRIDRLPACRVTWMPVILVSLAAIFEVYDLFQTGYVLPGLIRAGILSPTGGRIFGLSDQAFFGSVTFVGLFIGATCFASVADRLGRRTVFLYGLLGYSAATLLLAAQGTAGGVFLFRFLAGIGLGIDLVTMDAYLVELIPAHMRGRAFALNHVVQYLGVVIVALLSWLFIPNDPLGIAGWRWVELFGSVGALLVWYLRRGLVESPRWLAMNGRVAEAEAVVVAMEDRVVEETGAALGPSVPGDIEEAHRASFSTIFKPPYRRRTIMLSVFNFFQTIGFYGFSNWIPALLLAKGNDVTKSLLYAFCIACAYPLSSALWMTTVAERFERKWLIVTAAIGVTVAGVLFAVAQSPLLVVVLGIMVIAFSTMLSMTYHPYQAELFPTDIRARAVGFCYSFSRLSTALTSFFVAWALAEFGNPGVFTLISFAMFMVVVSIGGFGPRTRGRSLESISH